MNVPACSGSTANLTSPDPRDSRCLCVTCSFWPLSSATLAVLLMKRLTYSVSFRARIDVAREPTA